MAKANDSESSERKVRAKSTNTLENRLDVPVDKCEVEDKDKLARYRTKWTEWMSWYGEYGESDTQPNSIESQIQRMLFNDLTYRAAVSVRSSVDVNTPISARSSTLAYLLDQGYLVSQVLSIQKLLDTRKDVISVRRLLKDVEKHRELITREVYVSGTGLPYDYESWPTKIPESDPLTQAFGLDAPGMANYAISKSLHETFDRLSRKEPGQRSRGDLIPKSIFSRLGSWISGSSADEIKHIRDNFIAHAGNAMSQGFTKFKGLKFTQIDELQRGIVRVERALTDEILSIRVLRNVVPMPPLGIFHGLDLPYSPPETEESMHDRWKLLEAERNAWAHGVLDDLTANH